MKAAIVGFTGYTGLELVRLIHLHPVLEIGTLHSHSVQENSVNVYPHLQQLVNQRIYPFDPLQIMQENELVFLRHRLVLAKIWSRHLSNKTFL